MEYEDYMTYITERTMTLAGRIHTTAPLTPTQNAVYSILRTHPDGVCRRVFAQFDIFEVANRISEIEQRLGITIERDVCRRHAHKQRFTLYRLGGSA